MAHNITERDNLFTVRHPAWHGLGTVFEEYPTREQAQALAHPWEPIEEPVFRRKIVIPEGVPNECGHFIASDECSECETSWAVEPTPTVEYEEVLDRKFQVRSDNSDILGDVASTWESVSNNEMYDVAEAIQGNGVQVKYETGGTLKGGSKVWLLLRLEEPIVVKGDPHGAVIPYYALQNAHDGSGSFRGQATLTRIVCDNTAQHADLDSSARGTEFVFRHTANVKDRIEEAKQALAGWRNSINEWAMLSEHLMNVHVTDEQVQLFVESFAPMPKAGTVSARVVTNVEATRQSMWGILNGETSEGIKHTAYGLVQASIEFGNHVRATRGTDAASRTENIFRRNYLDRNDLVRKATNLVTSIAGV